MTVKPLFRMSRRLGTLLRDPEMRSAFAYLALRPHQWSRRRPEVTSGKPPYLSNVSSFIRRATPFSVDSLLRWGDERLRDDAFDLRLASRTLTAARLANLPWRERFADLEDEASLHRFSWLLPWLLHSRRFAREDVLDLVRAAQLDWIRAHPAPEPIEAWQAYTISERLMNWIIALLALGASLDDPVRRSIQDQGTHLSRNLEYYGEELTGNHLSNNGRALYAVGLLLGDRELAAMGRAIVLSEPKRLIEHKGFLREDSSHYQLLITRNYIEVLWLARCAGDDGVAEPLESLVREMSAASRFFLVRSPDGLTIPLIGDLSPDSSPRWLLEPDGWKTLFPDYANMLEPAGAPRAGAAMEREWVRLDRGPWTVFAHVNRGGVPFHPGHAHNDTGGIVAFRDGTPLVLDSGRRHYIDDEAGRYGRSSAAHSTLLVDRRDAAPESSWLIPSHFLQARTGSLPRITTGEDRFSIAHGGFARLAGVGTCSRTVEVKRDVLTISDEVEGSGRHRVSVVMHFPSEAAAEDVHFPETLHVVRRSGSASAEYGEEHPILSVIAEAEVDLPWRGVTTIEGNASC